MCLCTGGLASLHSEGPSHNCGRGTRFWSRWLACRFMSPEMGVIWFLADRWLGRRPPGPMPQLQGGVRHGFEVSRFSDFWPFWGGRAYSLRPSWQCLGCGVLGLFSSIFFSTSINKKKLIKKEYCRCGPHPLQVTSSRARPPLVKGADHIGPLFLEFWGWPLWFMASIALQGPHQPRTGGCSWCLIAL